MSSDGATLVTTDARSRAWMRSSEVALESAIRASLDRLFNGRSCLFHPRLPWTAGVEEWNPLNICLQVITSLGVSIIIGVARIFVRESWHEKAREARLRANSSQAEGLSVV
eukprot:scaffold207_cov409-Prasinococcus_capsulatus_cf.AAC.49